MSEALLRAVGDARDRLHGRLAARRALAGAAAASVPAAALAALALAGGPAWLAVAALAAGAAAGAAWGAWTTVTLEEAAVALDRAAGGADRVATAWEARGGAGEMERRLVAQAESALRPAVFPMTFRKRDAWAALAGGALALTALAAPREAGRRAPRADATDLERMVSEESARVSRSAGAAAAAAEKAGSEKAAAAAGSAQAAADRMEAARDPGKAASEIARAAAEVRAVIAELRATDPEAAKILERLADSLEAGGARLAAAGPERGASAQAGSGALDVPPPLTHSAFDLIPSAPADPVAVRRASWPPAYDAVVTHYFSEDVK
jgi:hypothetical protein